MIALLTSVDAEMALLRGEIEPHSTTSAGEISFLKGTLRSKPVALCAGGMGKVNAAHAATLLITRFAPSVICVFGIGGAYPLSGAKVGDLALAREEIAGDEGVLTNDGFQNTEYIGIPLIKTNAATIYNTFPAPKPSLDMAIRAIRNSLHFGKLHTGTFVTLSTCTGTSDKAQELEHRYGGLCENMEGAAVAQVAERHRTPWIEIRGISNIVEDRNLRKWDIPGAARAAQLAVIDIVETWVL